MSVLACPRCGEHFILATAPCWFSVTKQGIGAWHRGEAFGAYDVVAIHDSYAAMCNHSGCGWEGLVKECRT